METERTTVSRSLEVNMAAFARLLPGDGTILRHEFAPPGRPGEQVRCCLFCVDGMTDSGRVNECLIRPVVRLRARPEGALTDFLEKQVMQLCEVRQTADFPELVRGVLSGDTAVFCTGCGTALLVGSKGYARRGIQEPEGERYLKGPREGFTESLRGNQALLRRKLCTPDLRFESLTLGAVSGTRCALCYLERAVDRQALALLRARLARIRIDGVLDGNYIAELVRDSPRSAFRTTGTTERPDVAAAKLMEGRIVILTDGSPTALTLPHIFLEHLQAGEDYYVGFAFAGVSRVLRTLGFLLAVSAAPVYLALVTWHQDLLPLPLLLKIAAARQGVPLSSLAEILLLLLCFDLLREAGTRTPGSIGQTLSVVGGLVIGQAAVEAQLVSVSMLIVVALSGVTGLIAPKLKAPVILWRAALLLLASQLGLYGFLLGMAALALRLASLRSFGVPYLAALPLSGLGSAEDSLLRPSFRRMRRFGRFLAGKREGRP